MIYKTFLGQELVINCTFGFCNSSPPAVTWYRIQDDLPVDVSNSSHIKTNWKELNHSEGISYLIFQKIITNDSGLYQCRSKNVISHSINVSVHGECVLSVIYTCTEHRTKLTQQTYCYIAQLTCLHSTE